MRQGNTQVVGCLVSIGLPLRMILQQEDLYIIILAKFTLVEHTVLMVLVFVVLPMEVRNYDCFN